MAGSQTCRTLSEHGCGRATGYAEFNKIVTIGHKTHVAWLDSHDDAFVVRIRTLDRNTNRWSPTHTVGRAYDNHGGPSLARDARGYLHIVYYPHHHPFRYRRSLRPNDASQWTAEQQFGTRCTYSSLVCMPDDRLVLACRQSSSGRWKLNLYERPSDGQWQGPRTILHGNASSGYTRWQASLALGPVGKMLHMSFMIYEQKLADLGYAVGYLCSPDGGRTWQRADGAPLNLPATPATIDLVAGTREPAGPANFRPGNVAVDDTGAPWILYARLDRQPFETWVATPAPAGTWNRRPLLPAVQETWPGRSVKTPGNVAFTSDGTMYAAITTVDTGIEPKPAMWGHPSAETALLVSHDRGRTFRTFVVSTFDDDVPNWLVNLEKPTRHMLTPIPSMIYTHGLKGRTNKDIMSNDVIWCDVASLVESDPAD